MTQFNEHTRTNKKYAPLQIKNASLQNIKRLCLFRNQLLNRSIFLTSPSKQYQSYASAIP